MPISAYKYICLNPDAVKILLSNISDFFRYIDDRAFEAIFRLDASVTLLYIKQVDNRKLSIDQSEMNIFWGYSTNQKQIKVQQLRRGVLITLFSGSAGYTVKDSDPQSLIDLPYE